MVRRAFPARKWVISVVCSESHHILSVECNPKFSKLGALFNKPILCFCLRCSVIWSLKSASWEDRVLTKSCVCSNWLWRVLHSLVSPSTSSTAKDIALSLGNQSKHFSWKSKKNLSNAQFCKSNTKLKRLTILGQ